jgi:xylitol oxidase
VSDQAPEVELPWTWAGNRAYGFERWHEPTDVAQLRRLVRESSAVRVLGSRHCFNDIGDSGGDLVATAGLPVEIDVDATARTVRVSAWATYAQLGAALHAAGWAVPNTASLPHITVAGAIATGSHGSGDGNGALGTSVVGIELLGADGETRVLDRSDPDFAGRVVALGALGVWTHVVLAIEPTFEVASTVRLDVPWADVLGDLDAITGSAYSVSLFTDYRGDDVGQVWMKARTDQGGPALDLGRAATTEVHMLPRADPRAVTPQRGVPGPWHERLPHFRADETPSRGFELQSEYLVPRDRAVEALERLRGVGAQIAPVLQVGEIRTVAADDLWLSPAHDEPVVGLHFTWSLEPAAVDSAVALVEAVVLPLGARPHWGKVFGASAAQLAEAYPALPRAARLVAAEDPDGVFANDFLRRAGISPRR